MPGTEWHNALAYVTRTNGLWEFPPLYVCYLEISGTYRAYFVSISLLPRYRGANLRLLVDAIFTNFVALADRGIYFEEICANAFTPAGIAFCRTLQMKYVQDHQETGKMYSVGLSPLPALPFLRRYPEFVARYSRPREV